MSNLSTYQKSKLQAALERYRNAQLSAKNSEAPTIQDVSLDSLPAKHNDSNESESISKDSAPRTPLWNEFPSGSTSGEIHTHQNDETDARRELDLSTSTNSDLFRTTDKFGNPITLNAEQSAFVRLACSGKSCILIGAAGTGKTTSQKTAIQEMILTGLLPPLGNHDHKHLPPSSVAPGIAVVAYTRRATNNIRKNLSEDLQGNCLTIHKLLEYEPVYSEDIDPESGKIVKSMRFEATRNSHNPLPSTLRAIVIEEASMVSVELFKEIVEATPHNPIFIFLGDIQQLPPVFGSAILGFKMLELPTVELTEVYRQALDSPIISLAHRILSGVPLPENEFKSLNRAGELTLHAWKKKISAENATTTLAKFFISRLDAGAYNPETDGILMPFNKSCGTIELNNYIANTIAKRENRPVYEIISGFMRTYYSIGDKCLYDKQDCIIRNIYPNPQYTGKILPREHSVHMDYWGNKSGSPDESDDEHIDVDLLLSAAAGSADESSDERVKSASHIIELELLDSERTIQIKSAGEINALTLGYAITVHKSQGSEWERVYICLHHSHATMMQRELLYTAVTRAKKELFVICEPNSFEKGIVNQRIKGNTLAEKAEYFKGKIENGEMQS